jgi:peptidoglycan-associated lipoprotein
LTDVDRGALDAIATCLTTGPLQGDPIRLIGRADPRGGMEYNLALGTRRAKGAADYLSDHGLQAANIEQTSRGAMDAKGDDEATWASDRRVDVVLVK